MSLILFLKGFFIALIIAIPLGPAGILCLRRSFRDGFLSGFTTGLGVATADLFYAALASFGLTILIDVIQHHKNLLTLIGSIIIVAFGVLLLISDVKPPQSQKSYAFLGNFITGILITLSNPLTLLGFAAYFSLLGAITDYHGIGDVFLLAGVFVGTSTWFTLIASLVNLLKEQFKTGHLLLVNRIIGIIIMCFGSVMALYTLKKIIF